MNKIVALLLLGLCMIPFMPGLHGPFMLDDTSNLELARASTGSFGEIIYAITHNGSGLLRRPLANLSFLINYHWIGQEPYDYKLINLLFHWLNTYVVWRFSVQLLALLYSERKISEHEKCGLLIAAFWALHPIQVSTVLYAVQRMTELSTLFTMLALSVFLRLLEKDATPRPARTTIMRVVAVWSLVLLGLLCKENAALFPCFVLAIAISAAPAMCSLINRNIINKTLFALCCWVPLMLGTLLFAFAFSSLTAAYPSRDFTLTERLLTEPFIVFRYLGTILVPNIKHMGLYLDDMPIHQATEPLAWLVLLLIVALPLAAVALRKKAPALTFGVLWFLTAHLLESTVIPLELAFEHRNYLALLGPMFTAGYYLFSFLTARRLPVLQLAAALPILILLAGTTVRAHQWSSPNLFLQQEAENHPFSPRAQNELINLDIAAGNTEKIIAGVKKVQGLKPDAFWPLSLDFNLACGIPNYPIQWEKMEAQIKKRPGDVAIPGMLLFDTSGLTSSSCRYLDVPRFERFLITVGDIYQSNQMPSLVEKMLILRCKIAIYQKKPDVALVLFDAATQANPTGLLAVHELAYYALNIDKLEVAAAAIDLLEKRVQAYDPTSQYDVDELRGYLAQARSEKAAAEIKPQGLY